MQEKIQQSLEKISNPPTMLMRAWNLIWLFCDERLPPLEETTNKDGVIYFEIEFYEEPSFETGEFIDDVDILFLLVF